MTNIELPFRKRPKPKPAPTTVMDESEEEQRYKPIDLALVKRMLGTLRPYRRQYILGVTLGAAQGTLEMQSPKFTLGNAPLPAALTIGGLDPEGK